jgi:hypothetical protein
VEKEVYVQYKVWDPDTRRFVQKSSVIGGWRWSKPDGSGTIWKTLGNLRTSFSNGVLKKVRKKHPKIQILAYRVQIAVCGVPSIMDLLKK